MRLWLGIASLLASLLAYKWHYNVYGMTGRQKLNRKNLQWTLVLALLGIGIGLLIKEFME